jgi:hypothetical protein
VQDSAFNFISNTRRREHDLRKLELMNKLELADLEHKLRDITRNHKENDESSTNTHKIKLMEDNRAYYSGSNCNPQVSMVDSQQVLSTPQVQFAQSSMMTPDQVCKH